MSPSESAPDRPTPPRPGFLVGGGRMGERIAAFDWSRHPLGPIDGWPDVLRTSVNIVLGSPIAAALVWGPSLTTLYNDAFVPVLGGRTDSLGRSFADIWPDAWPEIAPLVERAFAGEATYLEDHPLVLTRHGFDEQAWFTFGYSPVRDADGRVVGMLDTCVETTRRVTAERDVHRLNADLEGEVREQAERRNLAWNHSQDLQLVLERDGRIRAVNRAWTTLLGWSVGESLGQSLQAFAGDDVDSEPAGTCADALVLVRRPDVVEATELCMRHRDGTTRWVSWLRSAEGDAIHASGRHVTTAKQAARQLAHAQAQLRQAQKMEAFGQLTGGIAHDFNNLLQAVSGSLEMLGRKHIHQEAGHRLLRLAGKALDRATHLTRQLLVFARRQSLDLRSIETNVAVAASIELARRSLPENMVLEHRLLPGAWPVLGDANQLDVAMLNLIINARDAMPDGGQILVSTANVVAPGDDVPDDLEPGQFVRIAVADVGVGMSEEVSTRAFEPFFTTKGVGKGTGLGLSQVYGFAHESGGSVRITSAPACGTTVDIFLPKAATTALPADAETARGVWRGRETVLVVDDDPDVRGLAVACLKEYGYRVLEAGSGVECLELLGQEASVDLLLIDYAMPEMNGAETVRLARRMRAELEVLFITGYADLRALNELVGPNAIVAKPFKLAQLADRVAESLARRKATADPVA